MVQTPYPEGSAVYQHDNAQIHTARLVTDWFNEHESESPMACTVTRFQYF